MSVWVCIDLLRKMAACGRVNNYSTHNNTKYYNNYLCRGDELDKNRRNIYQEPKVNEGRNFPPVYNEYERLMTYSGVEPCVMNPCCLTTRELAASLQKIIELLNKDLLEAHTKLCSLEKENSNLKAQVAREQCRENSIPTYYSDGSKCSFPPNQWRQPRKTFALKRTTGNQEDKIPTKNRFTTFESRPMVQHNLTYDAGSKIDTRKGKVSGHKEKVKEERKNQQSKIPVPCGKIHIFADSQGRGLSNKINDLLSNISICGFTKPGAPMAEVVKSIEYQSKELTQKDFVIIMGGTNSVAAHHGTGILLC